MALEKEFDYYLKYQEEFARTNYDQFVVIVGEEVLGFFSGEREAYETAIQTHPAGTFLIERCLPGQDHISSTFYSRRVAFA